MKVIKRTVKTAQANIKVLDAFVGNGLIKGGHAALPDIDIDFASDRRLEMKEYIEQRYNLNNKQRVFSAGTFTTLQLKAVLKDVGRVHKVPHKTINYITSKISNDEASWVGLFEAASSNNRIKNFIHTYPDLIEDIRSIIGQPKAPSIHASAVIITPNTKDGEDVECFDFLPIRKMNGLLVSEFDGYSVDEIGLLKNDMLSTIELTKLSKTISLVNSVYGKSYTIENISSKKLDNEAAYLLFHQGFTQNIFQFSGVGMTKFMMDMRPTCIEDLIAGNALYRPATIEVGATDDFVRYKNGEAAPVYDFGTYEATKNTYGLYCISENSIVTTGAGDKKIQDVVEGDLVLTEDGSYKCVTANMKRGVKKTIRVRTSHGEELVCTPDHRVLTQDGWIEAGSLDLKRHLIKGFWASDESDNVGTVRDWCYGYYLANGSSVSYPCALTCTTEQQAYFIKDIFNKEFNLDAQVYFNVRAWYVRLVAKTGYNGKFSPNYKQNEFNLFLREVGSLGKNVYNKTLPDNPSLMLISGFIDGDGCMANGAIRLGNKKLAYQLYKGLQSFRIPSSYYDDPDGAFVVKFNDNDTRKLKLKIRTHRDHSTKSTGVLVPASYLSTIDLSTLSVRTRKNIRAAIKNDRKVYKQTVERHGGVCCHDVWGSVLSIKEDMEVMTYDLSVDTNHSFCVGGLVVHNCYQEQFMSIANTLGGFDLGKCDYLRKAIGKKRMDIMASLKSDFISGAIKNGCPDYEAEEIWHKIELAGKYSFNKCISGKERLFRPSSKKGSFRPTIAEMYRIKNDRSYAESIGKISLHAKYKRSYGSSFSLNEENKLVINSIEDIIYQGKREIFRITLENGATLDVTDNHKHPTQRGKLRTDELVVGVDKMFFNIGHIQQDTVYRFSNKGTNNSDYHSSDNQYDYQQNSQKGKCGFQKLHTPFTNLKKYKREIMGDVCELCGAKGGRLEVHHCDGDHSNNDHENLKTLCASCHKKQHYEMGRTKMGRRGLYTQLMTVVSVESVGFEDVYDVCMKAPHHTFVTDKGVVTCNSHAAAYALTAFVAAYLKANYPTAFYTVALQYAEDKNIPILMGEMSQSCSATVVPPDINVSDVEFFTDYETNKIFWSLTRIKNVGVKTVEYIINERKRNGDYTSFENFVDRIKASKDESDERCPVNTRHIKMMIYTGCFDRIEGIKSIIERYALILRGIEYAGINIKEDELPQDMVGKHYFWSMKQIELSGIGSVDYRRVYDNCPEKESIKKTPYASIKDALTDEYDGKRVVMCATISDVFEQQYKDKKTGEQKSFGKIRLQQNNDSMELVMWSESFSVYRDILTKSVGKILLVTGQIKYSDYTKANGLQTTSKSTINIM
ncbi:MAG: hypothetical protein ACRDD8_06135 [Bacteroidales bacterium]